MKLPALMCGVALAGCAHWDLTQTYGPRQEVGRTLVGSPQIEEVSSQSFSAGFAGGGATYNNGYYGTGVMAGGLDASRESVHRTHCIQQAQIEYEQQVSMSPHVVGRAKDVVGSLTTGGIGLMILAGAASVYAFEKMKYQDDLSFYQMDPSFFPNPGAPPGQPTTAYAIGGAAVVTGAVWFVYSMAALPHGEAPQTQVHPRRWVESAYVEAEGCGLVPGDRPTASAH